MSSGKKGTSISIVHLREKGKIRNIEKTIGKNFVKKTLPTPKDICTKQLFNAIDTLEKINVDEKGIEPFLPEIFHKLDWLDKEDIIKRFVTLEFGRFLKYYTNAPQIEEPQSYQKDKDRKTLKKKASNHNSRAEDGFVRYFIPLGKKDKLYPRELLGIINKCSKTPIEVGRIDLMTNFAFFEIPEEQTHLLEKSVDGLIINGHKIRIERANAKDTNVKLKHTDNKRFQKGKEHSSKKRYTENNYKKSSRR